MKATEKQLSAIYAIARNKGIATKDIINHVQDVLGWDIDDLSIEEASDVIQWLQEQK